MDFNAFKDIVVARIPEISGEQLDRFRDMEYIGAGTIKSMSFQERI